MPVEAINGFSVPPAPDAAANSATLAGVDSNQNGLRDDVERQLAQTARTTADFSAALVYAKEYQALLTGSLPANRADALIAYSRVNCALIAASESVKRVDVRELLTNTLNP